MSKPFERLTETELGAIRQRFGAKSPEDTSRDPAIQSLTPQQLVNAYVGWYIGDGGWADRAISMYLRLCKTSNGLKT